MEPTTTTTTEVIDQQEIDRLWALKRMLYGKIHSINKKLSQLGIDPYSIPGNDDE